MSHADFWIAYTTAFGFGALLGYLFGAIREIRRATDRDIARLRRGARGEP